jgi:hypothetical protein
MPLVNFFDIQSFANGPIILNDSITINDNVQSSGLYQSNGNIEINGEVRLPIDDAATAPTLGAGNIRYNQTAGKLELWDTAWIPLENFSTSADYGITGEWYFDMSPGHRFTVADDPSLSSPNVYFNIADHNVDTGTNNNSIHLAALSPTKIGLMTIVSNDSDEVNVSIGSNTLNLAISDAAQQTIKLKSTTNDYITIDDASGNVTFSPKGEGAIEFDINVDSTILTDYTSLDGARHMVNLNDGTPGALASLNMTCKTSTTNVELLSTLAGIKLNCDSSDYSAQFGSSDTSNVMLFERISSTDTIKLGNSSTPLLTANVTTGTIEVISDPSTPLGIATKNYIDTHPNLLTDTALSSYAATGGISLTGDSIVLTSTALLPLTLSSGGPVDIIANSNEDINLTTNYRS